MNSVQILDGVDRLSAPFQLFWKNIATFVGLKNKWNKHVFLRFGIKKAC